MTAKIIRIATRQSPLALWQANYVRNRLLKESPKLTIELLPIKTTGDRFLKVKLQDIGGKRLFLKELEEALLDKRADIAVHSAKDMPANFPKGLSLAAICKRDNPFDAFVSKNYSNLQALPQKALVGTGSLRRQSQLLAYRPDLCVKPLRGNINTRLEKLTAGEYHAIILAAAGLERMGLADAVITEQLADTIMLPSCGQGALAIECRTADQEMHALITPLNDPISAVCVHTERQVNALLGGNCHVPLAVFCAPTHYSQLILQAKILSIDGRQAIHSRQIGAVDQAKKLADLCTQSLLAQGAAKLLASIQQ